MIPPPLPAAAPRSRPAVSRSMVWTICARGLMLAALALSIALVSWSLYQFQFVFPLVGRQIRLKDSERSNLAGEVQQAEMSWDAAAAEKLEAQYRQAREQLLGDKADAEKWTEEFKARAKELAFDADLRTGLAQAHTASNLNLVLVPATLQLQPAALGRGLTNSAYARLLELSAALENARQRVDLVELSVTSDSNSVHTARARLTLWAQSKPGATP